MPGGPGGLEFRTASVLAAGRKGPHGRGWWKDRRPAVASVVSQSLERVAPPQENGVQLLCGPSSPSANAGPPVTVGGRVPPVGGAEVGAHPPPPSAPDAPDRPRPAPWLLCSASNQVTACQHCGLGCALSFGKAQLDFLLGCSVMSQFQELSPHSLQSPVCSPQVTVAPGGVGNMCPRQ